MINLFQIVACFVTFTFTR